MNRTQSPPPDRRSHPPLWLVEGLDVVELRRSVLLTVTLGVLVVGGILAVVFPGLVPPVPVVGAAVGLAALLLGLAAAIGLDATDLRLRGPRHVGAAGGELVAVLPTAAEREGAATLANAVLEAREPGSPLLLGLAASGRDVRPTTAWTDALAVALEAEGVSVLCIDLASGRSPAPGLLEVVRDGVKLASAVRFAPDARLARLGAGEDLQAALGALSSLPGRLPRDLDVLLVALPMAASRQVVTAVRSLDHVLIVAQRDRTSRVELIAGLDALEAAGTRAQVALLDDRTASRLASRKGSPTPAPDTKTETAAESSAEAAPVPAESDSSEAAPAGPAEVADGSATTVTSPVQPVRAAAVSATWTSTVTAPDAGVRIADGPEAGISAESGEMSGSTSDSEAAHGSAGGSGVARAPRSNDVTGNGGSGVGDSEVVDRDPDAASGPRAGGAFGVGGAALAGAGVAAALEVRPSKPEPETPRSGQDDAAPATEGSQPRDVAIVHGVAEAAAIAMADSPESSLSESEPEHDRSVGGVVPVVGDPPTGRTLPGAYPPPAVELASEPAPDANPPAEPDTTDKIPTVERRAIRELDTEHDEMMRTTAQLSVLLHDLDIPGDEHRDDTP